MIKLKNIVFFGSNYLAKECLIKTHKTYPRGKIFVVTDKNYNKGKDSLYKYAIKNSFKVISLKQLGKTQKNFDIGFSVRYHRILKDKVIKRFKHGIVNLHGGLLPHYRGSSNHIFAILNNEKKFGVSLHYINSGVDTGDIIKRKIFLISKDETGYSLFKKVNIHGLKLFFDYLKNIKKGKIHKETPQNLRLGKNYQIRDLRKMQNIKLNKISKKNLIRKLRAFYHPKKNSIFTTINGTKLHIKLA